MALLLFFSCTEDDKENLSPSIPEIESPADKAVDVAKGAIFKWAKSVDPENDAITYDVLLSKNKEMKNAEKVKKAFGDTQFTLELDGHTTYYWQIVVMDADGNEVKSDVYSFTTVNSDPQLGAISFPANKAKNVEKNITLRWEATTDADNDEVKYNVYLSKEKDKLNETKVASDITTTEFQTGDLDGYSEYFWKVETVDSEGATDESEVYSFKTKNSAPAKVTIIAPVNEATNQNYKNLVLTWSKAIDPEGQAVSYNVYGADNADFEGQMKIAADYADTTIVVPAELEGNQQFFWKVEARDILDSVSVSDVASFTTKDKPINFAGEFYPANGATGVGSSFNLRWPRLTNAPGAKYTVFVSKNNLVFAGNDEIITNSKDTLYKYTKALSTHQIEPHSKYYVKVEATNKGQKYVSDTISFTTPNAIPQAFNLSFPANEAADVVENTTLSWQDAEDADGDLIKYKLYIGSSSNLTESDIVMKDSTKTSFKSETLAGETYYWKVKAYDKFGGERETQVRSFTTANSIPKATRPVVTSDENGKVEYNHKLHKNENIYFTWDFDRTTYTMYKPEGVVYDFYFSDNNVFEESEKLGQDQEWPQFMYKKDLLPDSKYYWKVVTKKGSIEVESDVFTFTTNNHRPSKVKTSISNQTINGDKVDVELSWTNSVDDEGDAVSYAVYSTTNWSVKEENKIAENITGNSYVLTGLIPNTEYKIIVVAKDAGGAISLKTHTKTTVKTKALPVSNEEGEVELYGVKYKTVKIGNKIWLAENYKYIPTDEVENCLVYGSDKTTKSDLEAEANYTKYGVLYKKAIAHKSSILPTTGGWRIPTLEEWKTLTDQGVEGMLEDGTWSGVSSTNSTKLNIKPGGVGNSGFTGEGSTTHIWSNKAVVGFSTKYNHVIFPAGSSSGGPVFSSHAKYIRLVKDAE